MAAPGNTMSLFSSPSINLGYLYLELSHICTNYDWLISRIHSLPANLLTSFYTSWTWINPIVQPFLVRGERIRDTNRLMCMGIHDAFFLTEITFLNVIFASYSFTQISCDVFLKQNPYPSLHAFLALLRPNTETT